MAIDQNGAIILSRAEAADLRGAIGSACDEQSRVYISTAGGLVRMFDFSAAGDMVPRGSFAVNGTRVKMAAAQGRLFVVGMSKVGMNYIFLRLFSIPDGAFLGAVNTDVPVSLNAPNGPLAVNQFAMNGSVFWHAGRRQFIYVPANPLEFWCFDKNGRLIEVNRPVNTHVRRASLYDAPGIKTRVRWSDYDQAFGAGALPDGRILVVARRGNHMPGNSLEHIEVFNDRFHLIDDNVMPNVVGAWLSGTDTEGNVYFTELHSLKGATVIKARLTK
jgi:hypothetical protein